MNLLHAFILSLFVFKINDNVSINTIIKNHNTTDLTPSQFKEIYTSATTIKPNFLLIDMKTQINKLKLAVAEDERAYNDSKPGKEDEAELQKAVDKEQKGKKEDVPDADKNKEKSS